MNHEKYLIDILNPEAVVIGGVFARSSDLLLPYAEDVIKRGVFGNYGWDEPLGACGLIAWTSPGWRSPPWRACWLTTTRRSWR